VRPDFKTVGADFKTGVPDFKTERPDFKTGGPDFKTGMLDFITRAACMTGDLEFRNGAHNTSRDGRHRTPPRIPHSGLET
jgi:hypothetical protein